MRQYQLISLGLYKIELDYHELALEQPNLNYLIQVLQQVVSYPLGSCKETSQVKILLENFLEQNMNLNQEMNRWGLSMNQGRCWI